MISLYSYDFHVPTAFTMKINISTKLNRDWNSMFYRSFYSNSCETNDFGFSKVQNFMSSCFWILRIMNIVLIYHLCDFCLFFRFIAMNNFDIPLASPARSSLHILQTSGTYNTACREIKSTFLERFLGKWTEWTDQTPFPFLYYFLYSAFYISCSINTCD